MVEIREQEVSYTASISGLKKSGRPWRRGPRVRGRSDLRYSPHPITVMCRILMKGIVQLQLEC